MVIADHKSSHAEGFEESFQQFCINGGMLGKGKKRETPLFEAIKICHSLWEEPDDFNIYNGAELTSYIIEHNLSKSAQSSKDEDKANFDYLEDEEDPFGLKAKKASV